MKNKKRTMILVIIALIAVVGILVGTTYAYFTASVTNATAVNENVITTGTMALEFTDGPEVKLENAAPGSQVEKTFKVKNIGTVSTKYDVYFSELVNTFLDKTDLVYTLESSDGGYSTTSEVQIPSTSSKMVDQQSIGVNETHNYKLTVKFKETNDNQNDNAGKQFSAVIRINEVKEAQLPSRTSDLRIGDRVRYSSTGNQGTIDTWVVIKEGAEPELVAEDISPESYILTGRDGYLNGIGLLNEQASSYINNNAIIKAARNIGYSSDQVEYCTSLSTCPVDYNDDSDDYYSNNDIALIENAIGNLNTNSNENYYISFRYLYDDFGKNYKIGYFNNYNNSIYSNNTMCLDSCAIESSFEMKIRPIITLQSNVKLNKNNNENEWIVLI